MKRISFPGLMLGVILGAVVALISGSWVLWLGLGLAVGLIIGTARGRRQGRRSALAYRVRV